MNHQSTASGGPTDITYIPMDRGYMYLVAIMDWHSRQYLSWRISNTLDSTFCLNALEEARGRFGPPDIFNTDQVSQGTSNAVTQVLQDNQVSIGMDG